MKYILEFEGQELDLILGALSELPVKVAGPLHTRILGAAIAQDKHAKEASLPQSPKRIRKIREANAPQAAQPK